MPTGGLVQGDQASIRVTVEPGSAVHLTTQSATRVYRSDGATARQELRLELHPSSYLEWWPDYLIPYRDADYQQDATLVVDPSATLLYSDSFLAGRLARGEQHVYRRLRLRTEVVRPNNLPVAIDLFHFEPSRLFPASLGLLGDALAVGTLLLLGPTVAALMSDSLSEILAREFPGRAAATRLPDGAGLLVRALCRQPKMLRALLARVLEHSRLVLFGQTERSSFRP